MKNTLDLRLALNCIKTDKDSKIGLIRETAPESLNHYKNEPIIFRDDYYSKDTVTIEKPMDEKLLKEHKERNPKSLMNTHSTMVCVPKNYVIEIKL